MIRPIALALALAAAPLAAQEDGALASFDAMTPATALTLAQAAFDACHDAGYQVAVAVVDRFGQTQVVLRDRFAGPHTVPTATEKAWTAVSFRASTLDLDARIAAGALSPGLRDIPGALILGGGLPATAAGSIVGGVGVSGAPDPAIDEDCARAGLDAITALLEF
jgi:uncharacterized protein GlcG (DUF336 family)